MDKLNDYNYLQEGYSFPQGYIIPPSSELKNLKVQPETNSLAFHHEIYYGEQEAIDFLPTYCFIQKVPKLNRFLLATNDFTSPIVRSSVIVAEDIDTFKQKSVSKADVIQSFDSTITNLTYLNENLVIVGKRDCELLLMSLYKQNDKISMYSNKFSLSSYVTQVAQSKDYILVGTNGGHLMKFQITSNLQLCSEEMFIHGSEITGVKTFDDQKYLTCSRDKSCLLWDSRSFPSAKLVLKHENQLTSIHSRTDEILLGDECGNLLKVDLRAPGKILVTTKISNREICSIVPNENQDLGIVSKSNETKILNNSLSTIFGHKSDGIIYSLLWDENDKSSFYVVGEHQITEKFSVESR